MKNKNYKKGFSILVFVIVVSAVLAFLTISDSFDESALQTQISAVEKHYENFYKTESDNAILQLETVHNGS